MRLPLRVSTLAIWLMVLAVSVAVIVQTRFVADLSAFMPKLPSERQQRLVEQLRDGVVARLIMIGIEGGDAAERARLSRELAAEMRRSNLFIGVQNGDATTTENDRLYFFNNRYLLSPAVTAERFTVDGLRDAIGSSLDSMTGNAGLILKRLLARDPTGETLQIIEQFSIDRQPHSVAGVWSARDGRRALLLTQTRVSGSDIDGQSAAIESIKAAFKRIPGRASDATLMMSGTGVFSVSSRATIEGEISRLAAASIVLVVALLLLVYRSLTLLALGLLPVLSGALVGVSAVSLGFGNVHGLTLAFGTTLIGEAVDYSIYLFIQQADGNASSRFWRTIRLGVLTSIAGFAALLFSGFPGLSQLGLYSISGLIAAALVTRYVLPALMPAGIALREMNTTGAVVDRIFSQARRLRWPAIILLLIAAAGVVFHSGGIWNRKLSALSPVSAAEQRLDMELRREMGAPDMRYLATFTAADEESALQMAERAGRVMQKLVSQDILGGFSSPALVLPSRKTQLSRQAALPGDGQLRQNLTRALAGMPLQPARLEGFLADTSSAARRPLLTRADLAGTSGALLVDSLLVRRDRDYLVLMPLRAGGAGPAGDPVDLGKVTNALAAENLAAVMVIDILEETTSIFENYLQEALVMSGLGCLAIAGLMLGSLRSLPRMLRVVTPLACAVLCVASALLLCGIQLTILHLVGLLLVVAVGSNYALFFDSLTQPDGSTERGRTQISLVVANLTTVGSFGLLGFSKVPVLSAIGTTVGIGAFLALVFSAVLAQEHSDADSQ